MKGVRYGCKHGKQYPLSTGKTSAKNAGTRTFGRAGLGMSRDTLARVAGFDYSWLRRFEKGRSGIRVETLILLAKGLGFPSGTILTAMEKALENKDKWLADYGKKPD